ncbi:MAG: RNA-binding protein [Clostridia bacterium]|nr:RNA-binding protein [Clostridia bacterium]
MEFEIGDIVVSIAGRDMGEFYVVKDVDEVYAYLVDGKGKPQQKPKKKKLKHIRPTGQKSVALKEKWLSGTKVLDAEIRKTVSSMYKL